MIDCMIRIADITSQCNFRPCFKTRTASPRNRSLTRLADLCSCTNLIWKALTKCWSWQDRLATRLKWPWLLICSLMLLLCSRVSSWRKTSREELSQRKLETSAREPLTGFAFFVKCCLRLQVWPLFVAVLQSLASILHLVVCCPLCSIFNELLDGGYFQDT